MTLPAGVTWRVGADGHPPIPNVAEWNASGQLIAMSQPNGFFVLPGGITVNSPRWLRFLEDQPQGRIYVQCDDSRPVTLTIKRGTYTLYRFVDNRWVPYTRTFASDTTVRAQGFMLDDKGVITSFW